MTGLPNRDDLPYHLPNTTRDQLRELGKILDLPFNLVEPTGEQGLAAMTAVITYRHLDRQGRREAMRVIHSLDNRDLVGKLEMRAVDTALVNKRWGAWSMTNEELIEDRDFHELFQKAGALVGVSFSASNFKDFVKEARKNGRVSNGGMATIVIWLSFASSSSRLSKLEAELERRTELRSYPLHQ